MENDNEKVYCDNNPNTYNNSNQSTYTDNSQNMYNNQETYTDSNPNAYSNSQESYTDNNQYNNQYAYGDSNPNMYMNNNQGMYTNNGSNMYMNTPNMQPQKKNNPLGIIGFVLSIVGLILICASPVVGIIFGIAGIICSALGIKKNLKMRGLGIAGLIISIIVLLISLILTVASIYVKSGSSSQNTSKQDVQQSSQNIDDKKDKADKKEKKKDSGEKEYVSDDINVVSSDPDNYKGKYIKFDACHVTQIQEDNDAIYYQVYIDLDYNNSVLVELPKSVSTSKISADYVSIDGQIKGNYSGQTIIGVDANWAYIIADSMTPTTYTDSFGKADTTWAYSDKIVEQNGAKIQVTKVEFNSIETRVYVTITNNSSANFSAWGYDAKIVQNGQQYETTYNYNADYPEISTDLLPGASTSGVICFPALQPSDLQFQMEASSEDWDLEFNPYSFDLTSQ